MRPKAPEDFKRVERFRQWIAEQCDVRNINPTSVKGSEELAATYNANKPQGEPELDAKAFRMWHQRKDLTANVQRSSCYTWARALDMPINDVLMAAGYMPEDRFAELSELPVATRWKYAALEQEERQQVHELIEELYCRRPR